MTKKYQNKNILIIGGSFGIGEELCKELANLGANLAIMARSKDKIKAICNELGKNHLSLEADILDEKNLTKSTQILERKWQQIDYIIFCVGIYEPMNLDNFNLKKAKEIININLTGFFNVIDSFLPLIKKEKVKNLAIISSVAGYFGMPNSLAYGASKSGLSNLTESLSIELKKYKVKTKLINPGFVKTRLTDKNKFKMPGIITANKAAKIIIRKLTKNKFEIAFPLIFVSLMKLLKFLPYKIRFLFFKK